MQPPGAGAQWALKSEPGVQSISNQGACLGLTSRRTYLGLYFEQSEMLLRFLDRGVMHSDLKVFKDNLGWSQQR